MTPICLECNISKTTRARDFKFGTQLCIGDAYSGRTNNFPESGRGLGHVTPTIFGIRSNLSPKLLELETSNLVGGIVLGMASRRTKNFPESRHGLGHVTPTIFGSTVGYPSDSLASCLPARRYASAGICESNVSVCPSVCLSRAGIVSKRRKLSS